MHSTAPRRVPCGVGVIVLNPRGEVLMGRRKGSHGAGTWSIPGGWMEHNETFIEAARRELKEETDLHLEAGHVVDAANALFPERDLHSVTILIWATSWLVLPP